jgi:hypothetical protein
VAAIEPSGVRIDADEYTLLHGPVLARLLLERGLVADYFIDPVVDQWARHPAVRGSRPGRGTPWPSSTKTGQARPGHDQPGLMY